MKSKSLNVIIFVFLMGCSNMNEKTKALEVSKVFVKDTLSFESISNAIEKKTALNTISWLEWNKFPYKPQVDFRIAHDDSLLFIKFYVKENHPLAKRSEPNSATHRDSCVEFFIDPMRDGNYYNFEFNCIGTTHLAYGPARSTRNFIPKEKIIDEIKTWSTMGDQPFEEKSGKFEWEMVIVIPATIFTYNEGFNFSNLIANANFYKCGDDTTKPHYLSWNPVKTKNPDFHRPEFFGTLNFK